MLNHEILFFLREGVEFSNSKVSDLPGEKAIESCYSVACSNISFRSNSYQ